MVALLIRLVALKPSDKTATDTSSTFTQLQTELSETKDKLSEAQKIIQEQPTTLNPENGIYIRQSRDLKQWTATVRYPTIIGQTNSPAFELSYGPDAPWGLLRIGFTDATSADGIPNGPAITPYLSLYTLEASNYFAEGNQGMTFDISVALRSTYEETIKLPKNVYIQNKDIYLGSDGTYIYLARYKNDDKDVKKEIDKLLTSFTMLHATKTPMYEDGQQKN